MNAAHKREEWHALMLCVGVVPALVCFSILGTNGGLGAPCDTAVAPYLLVQAGCSLRVPPIAQRRPANRSDAEMRVLLFATGHCVAHKRGVLLLLLAGRDRTAHGRDACDRHHRAVSLFALLVRLGDLRLDAGKLDHGAR